MVYNCYNHANLNKIFFYGTTTTPGKLAKLLQPRSDG